MEKVTKRGSWDRVYNLFQGKQGSRFWWICLGPYYINQFIKATRIVWYFLNPKLFVM